MHSAIPEHIDDSREILETARVLFVFEKREPMRRLSGGSVP
jgi:hypothetical protein